MEGGDQKEQSPLPLSQKGGRGFRRSDSRVSFNGDTTNERPSEMKEKPEAASRQSSVPGTLDVPIEHPAHSLSLSIYIYMV
jgi:hypothetical protein